MDQVGGLGDVVTGLGRACLQRGHAVRVILPFYECLNEASVQDLTKQLDFNCPKVGLLSLDQLCASHLADLADLACNHVPDRGCKAKMGNSGQYLTEPGLQRCCSRPAVPRCNRL